jgi:antitoxin component of MazEF toxin-antitoxin module
MIRKNSHRLIITQEKYALIIDKPILKMLDFSEQTLLELSIEGDALVIRPITKGKTRSTQEIKKIAQEIMDEYADVFRKLAE